jgi:undecaprenyl-diphosphatase
LIGFAITVYAILKNPKKLKWIHYKRFYCHSRRTNWIPSYPVPHGFFQFVFWIQEDDFVKLFRFLFNLGLSLLLCIEKIFDFSTRSVASVLPQKFYAVIPALILGKLFDEK